MYKTVHLYLFISLTCEFPKVFFFFFFLVVVVVVASVRVRRETREFTTTSMARERYELDLERETKGDVVAANDGLDVVVKSVVVVDSTAVRATLIRFPVLA